MTTINASFVRTDKDGKIVPAHGHVRAVPTHKRFKGDNTLIPTPFQVPIDGPFELEANGPEWCWKLSFTLYGVSHWTEYVTVPDTDETLEYKDLIKVDPSTLGPVQDDPDPAWWAALRAGIEGARPGPKGEPGERGPRGTRGNDGYDGRDGVNGRDGANGRDGSNVIPAETFIKQFAVVRGELSISANDEGAVVGVDSSASWIKAIDRAAARGGGVVTAKPGTYTVQGLPLRENVWLELEGVTLKHAPTATQPMFVADEAPVFTGGGIRGGNLIGYNKQQNGIDFGSVTTLEHFVLSNCYLRDFNIAWNGSKNDRFPMLHNTKFWFNKIGVYVFMNHPIVHFCDFRNNDVGVTGDLNDVYFLGCKFNFNRIGVQPDVERPEARISNTRFVGCAFSRNTEKGLVMHHFNSVTSCQFYGNNSDDTGLTILYGDNTVTANLFGYMGTQGSWGRAAILLTGNETLKNNIIANNNFQLLSPTGVGITCDPDAITAQNLRILGNTFAISYSTKAIAFKDSKVSNALIAENAFHLSAASTHITGEGTVELGELGPGGSDLINNTFISERATNPANAVRFKTMNGVTISGNRFRGFVDPIQADFWDGSKWGPNNGFTTYASNIAIIPADQTSITITHGVKHPRTDSARAIQVTPTNDMGKATKYWLTNVTKENFTIKVDQPPSGYQASFSWSIDVGR